MSWLLVKKRKLKKGEEALLSKVWQRIYDEYIQEFGLSETFISILQKELEIAKLQLERIITNDRSLETRIEIAQLELEEMRKEVVKSSFMDTKIAVESYLKFQVNIYTTSIREFYSYIPYLKAA